MIDWISHWAVLLVGFVLGAIWQGMARGDKRDG